MTIPPAPSSTPPRARRTSRRRRRAARCSSSTRQADRPAHHPPSKGTTTPGLLRVWAGGGSGDDPERALRAFVDDFVIRLARAEYAGVEAGGFTGAEVVYTEKDQAGKALPRKSRAFAVSSGEGVVIVHLWGTADAEAGVRTAYELAKRTVRPST
ncbi:lipoprotein [Streptomyces sp. NPDC059578]|uniref:lipoprotein n=1 Tax=Streptomyces sp. NPDC059578 TaxID=3346874 RepID=UPI00369A0EF3